MIVELTYAQFKTMLQGAGTYCKIYQKINGFYIAYIKCQTTFILYKCHVDIAADVSDFETNFKSTFSEVKKVVE